MLIICQKLHHALVLAWLELGRAAALAGDFEINAITGFRVDAAHLPRASVANAALGFSDRGGFLVQGDSVSDQASNLQLLSRQNFQGSVETHEEVIICVFVEHPRKGLFVHGRREAVGQDHVTTSRIREALHFEEANLIQASSEDVNDVTIVCNSLGEIIVELTRLGLFRTTGVPSTYLQRLLVVLDVVTIDVVM